MRKFWIIALLIVGQFAGFLVGMQKAEEQEVNAVALSWFRKGEALIGTDKEFSEEQLGFFQKSLEFEPDFAAAIYNLAVIYIHKRDFQKVSELSDRLIKIEPKDSRGYRFRARAASELGDSEAAITWLSKAVKLGPDDFWVWEELGHLQFNARKYEDALKSFLHLSELKPGSKDVYFNIALAQQNLGRLDEAVESYKRFLEAHPDEFQARFFLGLIYREKSLNEDALRELKLAEKIDPKHPELQQVLGELYLDLDNFDEARSRLEGREGDTARNLGNLGILAKNQDRPEEAASYLRKALMSEPENPLLWAHLGDVLAEMEKFQEAAEAYQRAIQYDPADFDSYLNLGAMLANFKQNAESRRFLEKAVEIQPDSGLAHFQLGIVLERLVEADLAQGHYLQAVDLGFVNPLLHFRLAILFARQQEAEKAIHHMRLSFQLEPRKYVPIVLEELQNVKSDLDSIRYTAPFRELLDEYKDYWYADQEPVPVPASGEEPPQ